VHEDCQDVVVADCKEIATYPGRDLQHRSIMNTHYWREGNLPNNSKCAVCKKSCFTAECLTGFRCGWCGITVKKDSLFIDRLLLWFFATYSFRQRIRIRINICIAIHFKSSVIRNKKKERYFVSMIEGLSQI